MSWPRVKLSDVATINPRLPRDVDESQQVTFVAMASASEDGHLLASEARVLSETKKGFTYFDRSDVLLAKITPCFENGKCLRPGQIPTEIGFGSTEFHVIRPDTESLDSLYLFYLVWSEKFRFLGEKSMSGAAGQKRVGSDFLKGFEIPLPPLPEQKRIAAILDKADAIRRKRQQAIQLADDFLRAVFLDMFGDPVTNPKGWGLRKLSEVCRQITVGVVVKPASYYVESGVPAIRSLNIKDYGISRENFVFFSNEDNETTLSKSRVYAGDLVIVRSGQPGKAAVITKDLDGVNAIDVLIARPDSGYINSDYLAYFFNSGAAKSIVLAEGRGQIQQHLNVGSLNAAEIPIPPLELQREFADILEKVKDKYLCSDEATYGDVFNSISQRAFSGQL